MSTLPTNLLQLFVRKKSLYVTVEGTEKIKPVEDLVELNLEKNELQNSLKLVLEQKLFYTKRLSVTLMSVTFERLSVTLMSVTFERLSVTLMSVTFERLSVTLMSVTFERLSVTLMSVTIELLL